MPCKFAIVEKGVNFKTNVVAYFATGIHKQIFFSQTCACDSICLRFAHVLLEWFVTNTFKTVQIFTMFTKYNHVNSLDLVYNG